MLLCCVLPVAACVALCCGQAWASEPPTNGTESVSNILFYQQPHVISSKPSDPVTIDVPPLVVPMNLNFWSKSSTDFISNFLNGDVSVQAPGDQTRPPRTSDSPKSEPSPSNKMTKPVIEAGAMMSPPKPSRIKLLSDLTPPPLPPQNKTQAKPMERPRLLMFGANLSKPTTLPRPPTPRSEQSVRPPPPPLPLSEMIANTDENYQKQWFVAVPLYVLEPNSLQSLPVHSAPPMQQNISATNVVASSSQKLRYIPLLVPSDWPMHPQLAQFGGLP